MTERMSFDTCMTERKMSCFNCSRKFKKGDGKTRYQRPNQLTHKLQDRKWVPGTHKPDFTILDGLENLSDGDVPLDRLKKHSAQSICHECQVYLRQAVNKKCELEYHIGILNDCVSQVTNEERRKYYKENYGVDRSGCCWACMYKFVPSDYKKKHSHRFNMKSIVVEEMTVGEAVNSLLEEQAETLIGLYGKKTYICRQCVNQLRNVIKAQCMFETLYASFTTLTNPSSVFAKLQAGEDVLYVADISSEKLECSLMGRDQDEDVGSTSKSLECVDNENKPFRKTVGNVHVTKTVSRRNASKRKHLEIEECDSNTDNVAEKDSEYISESNEIINSIGENTESIEAIPNEGGNGSVTLYEHSENMNTEVIDETCDVNNSDLDRTNNDFMMENNSQGGDNIKSKMQIKLNLKGSEIQEASVLEVGSKKPKLMTENEQIGQSAQCRTMSDQWKIYYYSKFAGRAEFIRLVFEEAGVPYTESTEDFPELRRLIIDGEMEGYPHFAPPMVTKGSLQISQTPVICRYLGEEFGLYPDSLEDRLHAEQINLCCHDYIAEGRLAFHGINSVGPYLSQKEETQPYIDRFVSERMPRWLKYFERVLGANNQGKGFLYGDKICYADLALFHIIHATESQFSDAYTKADYIPMIKAFKDRIASRSRIASYLKSDRWIGFCGDSMM